MSTKFGGRTHALESTVGVSDMVLLEPVNEDTCIDNLRARFDSDIIYVCSFTIRNAKIVFRLLRRIFLLQTYIGSVVVSLNPYKQLALYSNDVISTYRSRNIYELPPHVCVACHCLKSQYCAP